MEKYELYCVDDFLTDEQFIDWVLAPDAVSEKYWDNVFARYPLIKPNAVEARKILLSIRVKPNTPMPDHMRKELVSHVLSHSTKKRGLSNNRGSSFLIKAAQVIAAACLIFAVGFALYRYGIPLFTKETRDLVLVKQAGDNGEQKISNTSDIPLLILLPDKSTIVLGPKSHIVYDEYNFIAKREIYLFGEAFFEVEKQEGDASFVVNTNYLVAKVLGTSFRISAFDNQIAHRVTVNTGLVEVHKRKNQVSANEPSQKPDNVLHVAANQEVIYEIGQALLSYDDTQEKVAPSKEAAEELFSFQATPLEQVLATLSEQYSVTIILEDHVLAKRTITASLGELHLNDKLDLISKAAEANFQVVDGKILVKPNE